LVFSFLLVVSGLWMLITNLFYSSLFHFLSLPSTFSQVLMDQFLHGGKAGGGTIRWVAFSSEEALRATRVYCGEEAPIGQYLHFKIHIFCVDTFVDRTFTPSCMALLPLFGVGLEYFLCGGEA
jgi:hypothetical protein